MKFPEAFRFIYPLLSNTRHPVILDGKFSKNVISMLGFFSLSTLFDEVIIYKIAHPNQNTQLLIKTDQNFIAGNFFSRYTLIIWPSRSWYL